MGREKPTPGPIKALRLPADGSPPHVLTLQTFIADPPPPPPPRARLGYYRAMLEYLVDNDVVRHVPNVLVFWTPTAWELRDVVKAHCVDDERPWVNGRYSLFLTHAKEGLALNRYVSNGKTQYFGDAFVLMEVAYEWLPEEDMTDLIGVLRELRDEHVYPECLDVPEGVVGSNLLEVFRRDCFGE